MRPLLNDNAVLILNKNFSTFVFHKIPHDKECVWIMHFKCPYLIIKELLSFTILTLHPSFFFSSRFFGMSNFFSFQSFMLKKGEMIKDFTF